MPIYTDVAKKSEDPGVFQEIAQELYDLVDGAWRPWEEDVFLPAMLRKPLGYIYSEKERAKLAELCGFSLECFEHDGMSVERMISICIRYSADLGKDEDWIVELHRRNAKFVRIRDLPKLVSLCQFSGGDLRAA